MSGRSVQRVAVGTTHEHASAVFGLGHDAVFLSTFADLGRDVDLSTVRQVDVASSAEALTLLDQLLASVDVEVDLRVRVEYAEAVAEGLERLLDAHPLVGVSGVERIGGRLVLTLVHTRDATTARGSRLALDALALALESVPPQSSTAAAPVGEQPAPPAADTSRTGVPAYRPNAPARRRTPPAPVTVRVQRRLTDAAGARTARQQVVLTGWGLLALVVVVLVVYALAGAGRSWIIAILDVLTLCGVVVLGILVVSLQRDVHEQRRSVERRLTRQRAFLERRTDDLVRSQHALRNGQRDLPALAEHVEAIDTAHSALRAELRDWIGDVERRSAERPRNDERGRER